MAQDWLTARCWEALGGDAGVVEALAVSARARWLGGPLPVDELAVATVSCALLAGAELALARTGRRPEVSVSAEQVGLSFQSERHARLRGEPLGAGFALLSRFVRCADGWARTHANYPHHAAALRRVAGLDEGAGPEDLSRAVATRPALAFEAEVVGAGGCAAALRTPEAWLAEPAGAAASTGGLIGYGPAAASPPLPQAGAGPASGLRVLDLTRVIAGPVAGRTSGAGSTRSSRSRRGSRPCAGATTAGPASYLPRRSITAPDS